MTVAPPSQRPAAATALLERRWFWLIAAMLAIGVLLRLDVDRTFDGRSFAPWREADDFQIAHNFARDDANILYPRIDWQADTPGYAEMEFPLLPWLGAMLLRAFGDHEQLLRLPPALFAILSLLAFASLARRRLPPSGAAVAVAAFAVNPLLVDLGTSFQPESAMLFFGIAAVARLWRWSDEPRPGHLMLAAALLACAILAKLTIGCIGILFAYVVLRRRGAAALASPSVWAAAALALLPPLAWYGWAHGFWLVYGNSLGVSNESHFIGVDMILAPVAFLRGNLRVEVVLVFGPAGLLLAAAALRAAREQIRIPLAWYASVWVFYVGTARTSGDGWAFYYHCLSVPAACLLSGAGAAVLLGRGDRRVGVRRAVGIGLVALAIGGSAAAAAKFVLERHAVTLTLGGRPVTIAGHALLNDFHYNRDLLACARQFAPLIPPSAPILVRGGPPVDEYGYPVAYNESMVFAWIDRRGFNYPAGATDPASFDSFVARGARYWIAPAEDLAGTELGERAERRYRQIASCDRGYSLYDMMRQ